MVCLGVLALRIKEPDRPRPFRVPFVWVVAPLGAVSCLYVMTGLPTHRLVPLRHLDGDRGVIYFLYGFRHSKLASRPKT